MDSTKLNASQLNQIKQQDPSAQQSNNAVDSAEDAALAAQAALFKQLLQGGNLAGAAGVDVSTNPTMDISKYLSAGMAANPGALNNLDAAALQELLANLQSQSGMEALVEELKQALSKKNQSTEAQNPANVILQNMMGPTLQGLEAKPVAPESRIASMVDTVAQTIMVSNPQLSGNKEQVLIVLKPDVLPGAQVMLSRENGALQVVFQVSVKDSANFLAQNQAALQNFLVGRLDEPVHVRVQEVTTTAQGSQSGDNEGRSRGEYIPEDDTTA